MTQGGRSHITLLFLIFLLFWNHAAGQRSSGLWNQQSLNGEVRLEGLYRQQKSIIRDFTDIQKSNYYIAGLSLRSRSYLWNPGILTLDIGGEFNPGTRSEKYIKIPDRSEVRTMNKLDVQSTLFSGKPITLSSFLNMNRGFYNRENLTNVKSVNKQYGGRLLLNNQILPVSVAYRNLDWIQTETETNRVFTMNQNNLEARMNRSFGDFNKNELILDHDNYLYTYADKDTVQSRINQGTLNNIFYFDKQKKCSVQSRINLFDQKGAYTFQRFDVYEGYWFQLPAGFRLSGNYNYYTLKELSQEMRKNVVRGLLEHQLFLSLKSQLFYEYTSVKQTVYDEKFARVGVDFNYTKKIPLGRLNLYYRYSFIRRSMDSKPAPVQVFDETHILSDGVIELLDRPYVDPLSVVVKDVTGTIIYQENFDYFLIERNGYLEVQRIPGGQIANGQEVLVDYSASQQGDYSYNMNVSGGGISLRLFGNLVEMYYNTAGQDYSNIKQSGLITLNYFHRDVIGTRISVSFLEAGVEYDHYQSNIIPYKLLLYYVHLNARVKNRFLVSLNGTMRDYLLIDNQKNQIYANISGRMTYRFRKQTNVSLESGYLLQRGINLDLDVLTAKAEVSTQLRQLQIRGGFEWYSRKYTAEALTMGGVFLKAIRKF